jgi:D-alanyl-D-alanine carboxypeptidase
MRKLLILLLLAVPMFADDEIDNAVNEILTKTGAPSASVAVVRDGKLLYAHAYGLARLESKTPATPAMRYSIGSISKQITATANQMLAEEGKLSLDDRVVRWLPELTRAKDVTIRQLLSMTSGYQDFWPQDYVMPGMLEPATPRQIADTWAKKPLDFEPGSKWQYSNTNYTIAGMIAERVAGMPLIDFLRQRVFTPLQMTSVFDTDAGPLPAEDPARYLRYALGPLRPAPKEGKGWMFAAGELAMTAQDLAKWDISLIDESLLKPASYRELERETLLSGGAGAHYGLGVSVNTVDGRRVISHGGEVSGFTAQNAVYPDQRTAVVVLTNLDATSASEQIATKIAQLLFATTDPGTETATAQARKIFEGLQKGQIDRALFTSNANAYFSEQAVKDFAASLGPLGTPQELTQIAQSLRGGMTLRRYRVKFPNKTLRAWSFAMPDGKLEQFMVAAVE